MKTLFDIEKKIIVKIAFAWRAWHFNLRRRLLLPLTSKDMYVRIYRVDLAPSNGSRTIY